jgi:hypothetical protein
MNQELFLAGRVLPFELIVAEDLSSGGLDKLFPFEGLFLLGRKLFLLANLLLSPVSRDNVLVGLDL